MPVNVFISSKIKDGELDRERKLARKIVNELNLEPVMWELLPPSMPKLVEEAYLDGVRLSQVYVGIIGAIDSPGSLEEFEEAVKLDKKCFMFVKNVAERQPGAGEFLQRAKKFKYSEYSEPNEFSQKLEESLLAFMAEQTLAHLEARANSQQFARAYAREYIRPLLDEARIIENTLTEREFSTLPTGAWDAVCKGIFVGTDSDLDQRIAEFYSKVCGLNEMRKRAVEEHKENVASVLEKAFHDGAKGLGGYYAIERVLMDNFGFFVTRHPYDDYYDLAEPVLGELDEPVRSITTEHRKIPGVSAVWLIDNLFRQSLVGQFFGRNRSAAYVAASDALLPEAKRVRELLLKIYKGT